MQRCQVGLWVPRHPQGAHGRWLAALPCTAPLAEAAAHPPPPPWARPTQEALDACFRLSWALVHSRAASDVGRGVELAEALADTPGAEARDLRYLVAVGRYRQRHHIEARKLLKALLLVRALRRWGRGARPAREAGRSRRRPQLPLGACWEACMLTLALVLHLPQEHPEFRQAEALLELCDKVR